MGSFGFSFHCIEANIFRIRWRTPVVTGWASGAHAASSGYQTLKLTSDIIYYIIYICVYYIYDKYHSISFHIIHISRMWPCVILCLVVLIGYYGLLWLHVASFSLFSSPAFARASIAAMTAGGAPVRLPKGLRWLLQWLSTHFGMFDLSCWMNIKTNPITTPISSNLQLPCWLVVWNMAFIFHILGIN